jgi:uncharacterized protein YcnI
MRVVKSAVVVGVAAALAVAAPPATAHVQIKPTEAAPGDSVMFELLVPGERDARTVEVAVQIPEGVLPFSYEDTPGWRRTVTFADDGSTDVVRWRGRLAKDGFVRFGFLAATPEQEGEIAWKAIQTYSDGSKARWIGPVDSEEPAAVTTVSESAPRVNAGGEGAVERAAARDDRGQPAAATPTATAMAMDDGGDGGGGSSTVALLFGIAGLLLGGAALAVALRRRPVTPPRQPEAPSGAA